MRAYLPEILTILFIFLSAFVAAGQAKSYIIIIYTLNAIVYILLKRQQRIEKHEIIKG